MSWINGTYAGNFGGSSDIGMRSAISPDMMRSKEKGLDELSLLDVFLTIFSLGMVFLFFFFSFKLLIALGLPCMISLIPLAVILFVSKKGVK